MQSAIDRLISETVIAIFRANGRLLEWGDAFASPFGLTSARWQMLGAIAWAENALTAPRIAEQMGVSRQGVQKQLNLLVDDGLIARITNPAHRRSPFYRLTPRGQALYEQVNAAWEAHAQSIGEAFAESDLKTTLRVLNDLTTHHVQAGQGDDDET